MLVSWAQAPSFNKLEHKLFECVFCQWRDDPQGELLIFVSTPTGKVSATGGKLESSVTARLLCRLNGSDMEG